MTKAHSVFLELKDVGHSFQKGPAVLQALSLRVQQNEFVALVGATGSGKSTILRILAGLQIPLQGSVTADSPIFSSPGAIGYVFQEAHLLGWRTVFNNVRLPLELMTKPQENISDKVHRILNLVGLDKASELFPHQLSGGMKMRVSLARALVTEPKLLLLDEPFAALDEVTRYRLMDEIQKLHQDLAMTTVLVTHSISEAAYLSHRILMLQGGRFVREDSIAFSYPRTATLRREARFSQCVEELRATFQQIRGDA